MATPLIIWATGVATELTLDTDGIITVGTNGYYTVDTFEDGASDDLVTISGGYEGQMIILRASNDGRTVVLKHNTGNIWIPSASDISLDDIRDSVLLFYDGTKWIAVNAFAAVTKAAFDDHSAQHLVAAADTIFPADPGADKYLKWDDDPGELVWDSPAGSGAVATDTIWDAKGDLAVGTGADTADKLTIGSEDDVLMVQSGTPAWVASAVGAEIAGVVAAGAGSGNTFSRGDHVHAINHAITDNHLLTVDGTLEDNDFAYATANGIEGKTAAESLTLLLANPLTENDAIKLDAALSADGKYNGITQTGVAGATLAFGDVIYQAVADNRWELAKADAAATCSGRLGICILAAASNGDATNVLLWGTVRADTAFPEFTKYAPVFISSGTAGDLVTTVPSKSTNHCVRCVGQAITADELEFHPSPDWLVYA